jgi:hypothetical protein
MAAKVMTSAEEARENVKNIFRAFAWKGTDLHLVFVENAK